MKPFLLLTTTLLFMSITQAQVVTNNTNPQAALDIIAGTTPSNTDGILISRVDEYPTGMTPAHDGMLAFLKESGTPAKGFYYFSDGANGCLLQVN